MKKMLLTISALLVFTAAVVADPPQPCINSGKMPGSHGCPPVFVTK
jgi:hypothetical protein